MAESLKTSAWQLFIMTKKFNYVKTKYHNRNIICWADKDHLSNSHSFSKSLSLSLSLQDLASSLKVPFMETSAKSSNKVETAFLTMASEIHKRLASDEASMQGGSSQAQTTKINSAPLWLGGEKQTQEASNCCWYWLTIKRCSDVDVIINTSVAARLSKNKKIT